MANEQRAAAHAAGGGLDRRDFLRGAMAAAVAGTGAALSSHARAQAQPEGARTPGREFLISGGHVLSMDRNVGDLPEGDVHVRDGTIVAVGRKLSAPGAQVIDARGMIVMPGFVDAHSHLWNAFLRGSVRGDDPLRGYFPTTNRAAPLCTPDDAFHSVRFGLMQELLSGVTCLNNFSHNTRSVAHADAEIRAALDVGARTRFSYGTPGRGERLDLAGVKATLAKWGRADPRLRLGVNLQLPTPAVLKAGGSDETFVGEVRASRELGLPISLHYGDTAHGLVGLMDRSNLLGPDILMIHTQGFTAAERELMVKKQVQFSMSPAIEIPYSTVRNGYIQFAELEALGASLSLSVDASSALATGDFFTVMRALLWAHKQRADVDRKLEPRRIVEIATLGGAKVLGMDDIIGSLSAGKQADIILVRKRDINMAPVIDPYYSLVYSGMPANVDTVMVGGRVLLQGGRHATLDVREVADLAARAGSKMHERLEGIISNSKENLGDLNRKG